MVGSARRIIARETEKWAKWLSSLASSLNRPHPVAAISEPTLKGPRRQFLHLAVGTAALPGPPCIYWVFKGSDGQGSRMPIRRQGGACRKAAVYHVQTRFLSRR